MKKFVCSLLFYIVLDVLTSACWAQCSAVLKYGIFDLSSKAKDDAFVESIINALSKNDYGSASEFASSAGGGGLNIGVFGLDAEFENKRDKSMTWSKSAAAYLRSHKEGYSKFKENVMKANPDILTAWTECIKNEKGLVAWLTPSANRNELVLNIEARPKSSEHSNTQITVSIGSTYHIEKVDPFKITIGGSPVPKILQRGCEGANLAITSDNANYNADALELNEICPTPPKGCQISEITSTLIKRKNKKEWALLLFDESLNKTVKKIIPNETVLNRLFVTSDMVEVEDCQWETFSVGDVIHPDTEVVIQNINGWRYTFCLKDPKSKSIRIITRRGLKIYRIPQDVSNREKVRLVESFAQAFPDYSLPFYDSPGNIQEKIHGNLALTKAAYPD